CRRRWSAAGPTAGRRARSSTSRPTVCPGRRPGWSRSWTAWPTSRRRPWPALPVRTSSRRGNGTRRWPAWRGGSAGGAASGDWTPEELQEVNEDGGPPPLTSGEVERIAASVARYEPDLVSVALAEHHWDQMHAERTAEGEAPAADPGPIPEHLLHVPGFVSE